MSPVTAEQATQTAIVEGSNTMPITLPKRKPLIPLELLYKPNGKLPANLLHTYTPGTGQLTGRALWWFTVLKHEAAKAGFQLTYTPGGCYRTYTQQYNLFLSRYEPCSFAVWLITPTSRRKTWNENSQNKYWRKKLINGSYPATAAVPGYSNHGLALSVDLALGAKPSEAKSLTVAAINWLVANAPKYGIYAESDAEPWHWSYALGDKNPA